MDKTYQPKAIETHYYQKWEAQKYFEPNGQDAHFCIMLPPPNVTGSLHMGHAFQQTIMDILVRYHRMCGDKTLWQCGIDHAGIATQMVVERQLEAEGKSRKELGREQFTQQVYQWKNVSGNTISNQSRRLGTSMDWQRERFTMDDGLSVAVREVFIRLYHEGLIYKGNRLVNWDPVLHTAISDLEVISNEESGNLWYIRYPISDSQDFVTIATTRPETMFGDAAVAVHPDDDRYQHLIGKKLSIPLTEQEIPVIADSHVDPKFGTGCLKITPAHDFNDYKIGSRHQLPIVNIFTPEACLNDQVPTDYRGLERYVARKKIVANLADQGLIEKTSEHQMTIPRGDRSGVVIEPYLTEQWYVKVAPLAEPAISAVEKGDVRFIPEHWCNTYFAWMREIEDWCISRQLWWGHRIPAWYDEQGNIYVAHDEQEVRKKYQLNDDCILRQDEDVLDTWFSSALWPFSTLGWPNNTQDLNDYYPTNVLVTGFDIIFFWVARMIMMGLKFTNQVPFKEVYIHGLVRDAEGQKMSKSKANVIDPLDLIDGIELSSLMEKRMTGLLQPEQQKIETITKQQFPEGISAYGADALRFTFAALATHGRDIRFDIGRIQGYRNFCNKLWNAARYVLMNAEKLSFKPITHQPASINFADRWIISRLHETTEAVHKGINTYRFDLATKALYEFTWEDYCDWYLELSKISLAYNEADKAYTMHILLTVLETLQRLLHPFIPFITESIWQKCKPWLNAQGDTIMLATYPNSADFHYDDAAVQEFNWIKAFVLGVRRIRSERDIAPNKIINIQFKDGTNQEQQWLAKNTHYIKKLAHLDTIKNTTEQKEDMIMATAGSMIILVSLHDMINVVDELSYINKHLSNLHKERQSLQKKLDNPDFVSRAPQAVVGKTKQRLSDNTNQINRYEKQYQSLQKSAR